MDPPPASQLSFSGKIPAQNVFNFKTLTFFGRYIVEKFSSYIKANIVIHFYLIFYAYHVSSFLSLLVIFRRVLKIAKSDC